MTSSSSFKNERMTMKQARFDVFKFSLNGLDKANKQEARAALAIRLGAKPAKKPCLPYNEYKAQQKAAKESAQKAREFQKISGVKVPSARPGSSFKKYKPLGSAQQAKKKSGVKGKQQNISMRVGKFDGGMLKLSAKDIAKLKSK